MQSRILQCHRCYWQFAYTHMYYYTKICHFIFQIFAIAAPQSYLIFCQTEHDSKKLTNQVQLTSCPASMTVRTWPIRSNLPHIPPTWQWEPDQSGPTYLMSHQHDDENLTNQIQLPSCPANMTVRTWPIRSNLPHVLPTWLWEPDQSSPTYLMPCQHDSENLTNQVLIIHPFAILVPG